MAVSCVSPSVGGSAPKRARTSNCMDRTSQSSASQVVFRTKDAVGVIFSFLSAIEIGGCARLNSLAHTVVARPKIVELMLRDLARDERENNTGRSAYHNSSLYYLSDRISSNIFRSLQGAEDSLRRVRDFQVRMLEAFHIQYSEATVARLEALNKQALMVELVADSLLHTKRFAGDATPSLNADELVYLIWSFIVGEIPVKTQFLEEIRDALAAKELIELDPKILNELTLFFAKNVGNRQLGIKLFNAIKTKDLSKYSVVLLYDLIWVCMRLKVVDKEFLKKAIEEIQAQRFYGLTGDQLVYLVWVLDSAQIRDAHLYEGFAKVLNDINLKNLGAMQLFTLVVAFARAQLKNGPFLKSLKKVFLIYKPKELRFLNTEQRRSWKWARLQLFSKSS